MQTFVYHRFPNLAKLGEWVEEHNHQGYVLAGPIQTVMIKRWAWLIFTFGDIQVYEATMVKEIK